MQLMIIGSAPFPLVTLVANPLTGRVEMALSPDAIKLYGPIYPTILRQQLENAVEMAKELEKTTYLPPTEQ